MARVALGGYCGWCQATSSALTHRLLQAHAGASLIKTRRPKVQPLQADSSNFPVQTRIVGVDSFNNHPRHVHIHFTMRHTHPARHIATPIAGCLLHRTLFHTVDRPCLKVVRLSSDVHNHSESFGKIHFLVKTRPPTSVHS